jgi:hypothetical protein
MLRKFLKLLENSCVIILFIHILKLEISGCDKQRGGGGDAVRSCTAWCWRQCAAASWGRAVAGAEHSEHDMEGLACKLCRRQRCCWYVCCFVHAEGHKKRTVAVCTIGSLVFVLPRPALLEDEDAYGVRHVHRGVHRP